jgi:acyl carrier protein
MTKTEEIVKEIWCREFGRDDVSLHDNFFEIGGDSIKAMKILHEVQKQLIYINISEVFEYQTIREIAGYINRVSEEDISKQLGFMPMQNRNNYVEDMDELMELLISK